LAFQKPAFEITICDLKMINMKANAALVPIERIQNLIFLIRGEKVLLGQQLAELYGVQVKVIMQAVKRNQERFPRDFAFQLTRQEFTNLKSQIVTSSWGGLRRAMPYAFTEQGVAMLSSVLRSERAVQVNVAVIRAFVNLRRLIATNETLARKLAELERRLEGHDKSIKSLFDAIRELMVPPPKSKREIGFHAIAKETAESKAVSKRKMR
jgi:hypothetical protein